MAHIRKKVLYIITKSIWAGAGKYVYDLATNLPHYKFEVLVAGGGSGEMAQKIKEKNIPYYNIENFQRDVSVFKDFFAFFEILSLLNKTRPDIIHVSSSKAGGITGPAILFYRIFNFLSLKGLSLKTIFTAHGWAFSEKRPKLQIKFIKIFSKITALFYNKIICVSEFDRQNALKNKVTSRKKLITIHNGIDPENYNFLSKSEAREKLIKNYNLKIKNSDLWVGTIGENTKNKGHKYLQKALPNSVIIQNLPQGYNYLRAFDIFVLPSLKEGLPYIVLEAGLARVPVVATRVGGIPEIIEDKKTGLLVNPANALKLKEAIKKLENNPEKKNTLSFALWEKINKEFVLKNMLDVTISTYVKNSRPSKQH
ncbi:glycosyltransferase [Patescibacteria group bacterium]